MLENKTTDDFIFVKQHIYRIFQWMHETPLINNGNTPVTDRLIADVRWMLEHHYYPSPGQVDRIISVLRETKWICPYISRHLLSLNPLLACCRRYSRGER